MSPVTEDEPFLPIPKPGRTESNFLDTSALNESQRLVATKMNLEIEDEKM